MKWAVLITNTWTRVEKLYPVIYYWESEAIQKANSYRDINNETKVIKL